MEGDVCEGCGERSVGMDLEGLVMVCDACGLVRQEVDLRRAEYNKEGEWLGTYVGGVGTIASIGARPSFASDTYRIDARRNYTFTRLDTIASLNRLPKDKVEDVKHMLDVVTESKWGSGRWIDILIGTCIYVVTRQNHLPVLAAEIADSIDCSVRELFKMYHQVCHLMNLNSPSINQSVLFDHVIFHSNAFSSMSRETLRKLCKQGHLLLELGSVWYLSSGRHPSSLAAAAVFIISKANNINVSLEEISQELHIHPQTTRGRVKEFTEYLVGYGQCLPWGKDINSKTVMRHISFLLQYSQQTVMKPSLGKLAENDAKCVMPRKKREVLKGAQAPLAKALCAEYGKRTNEVLSSQSFNLKEEGSMVVSEESNASQIVGQGHEGLTTAIQLSGKNSVSCDGEMDVPSLKKRKRDDDGIDKEGTERNLGAIDERTCALSQKIEKWQPLPPSFVAGEAAQALRAAKIEAIKERITSVKRDILAEIRMGKILSDDKPCQSDTKIKNPLDAEDMIIQYCLLRGGDEKLLEAGYYGHVLFTPPVQQCFNISSDEDLLQYFNTPKEVAFLKSISKGEPPNPWLTSDELHHQQ